MNTQNSRQALADGPLHNRSWLRRTSAIIRYASRKAAYSQYWLRSLLEPASVSAADAANRWDDAMSRSSQSTYLGHTITVDATNAVTATLITYHAVDDPSVLDVGCSAASLVSRLHSYSRYWGIDVSPFAIEEALKEIGHYPCVALQASDIREFTTDLMWDVIVFNEVLYYLNSNDAMDEVERYSRFLSPGGIICIAMKHDPKSAAIFSLLNSKFRWIDGMLWQRKFAGSDYAIRINREQPALLLGVFKPG